MAGPAAGPRRRAPERWQSGRMRRIRNPVYRSPVPWVRIPPFPPDRQTKTGLAPVFFFFPGSSPRWEKARTAGARASDWVGFGSRGIRFGGLRREPRQCGGMASFLARLPCSAPLRACHRFDLACPRRAGLAPLYESPVPEAPLSLDRSHDLNVREGRRVLGVWRKQARDGLRSLVGAMDGGAERCARPPGHGGPVRSRRFSLALDRSHDRGVQSEPSIRSSRRGTRAPASRSRENNLFPCPIPAPATRRCLFRPAPEAPPALAFRAR